MSHESAYAALADLLAGLAPTPSHGKDGVVSAASISPNLSLPGDDTREKARLEQTIIELVTRVQKLELKASTVPASSLPATPNEPPLSSFTPATSSATSTPATSAREAFVMSDDEQYGDSLTSHRQRSGSWVNELLSATEGASPETSRNLTESQLLQLRQHVQEQARMIQEQQQCIDQTNASIQQQQEATKMALGGIEHSIDDVEKLKRELSKNQQINLTYQKVLREIGSIVTAVANGDLSKKVLISAKERDPEIATFKRTINRMVDQLQEFSSQVTHLAKEVGTEGRLGGQAVLPGVDGIWAELTQNGIEHRSPDFGPPC